jgi:hypothetical protein
VQRFLVRLVERFGKSRHEPPARCIAAELGEIDNARQSRAGDQPAKCAANLDSDRHVGVFAAKHHDRITERLKGKRARQRIPAGSGRRLAIDE